MLRGIEAPIAHRSNVVHAAIGFDEVVHHHMNVVVVNVNGHSLLVLGFGWGSIGGHGDAIMKIGDRVVADDVALAIDLDSIVGFDGMRLILSEVGPADQAIPVVAAHEHIVGNVVVLRSRILGRDTDAHVFHPAVPNYKA